MSAAALPRNLRIGTSSFATDDWVGPFYPDGTVQQEYLPRYAERFDTVEIDATFYRVPTRRQVEGWRDRTPEGFLFAAKFPQTVTHKEISDESLDELARFLEVMRILGPKLGPLLLQFPYISKARQSEEYATGDRFREKLAALFERLPSDLRFAVEVRNEKWLSEPLLELFRSKGASLAFIDYYTMPGMVRFAAQPGSLTSTFAYVRFLGHHRQMDALVEEKAKDGGRRWDAVVKDRTREMQAWAPVLRGVSERAGEVLVYFNNHYAGHAPGSIDLFRSVWASLEP